MWVGVRPSADAKGPLLRAGVLGGVRGALLLLPMRPLQTLLGGRRPCYHGSLPASPTPPSRDPRGRLAAGASLDTARPAFAGGQAVFPGCSPGGGRYPAIAEGSCSASVPAQRAGFRSPLSLPQLRPREREARRGQGQGARRPLVPEAPRPRPPVSSSPPFRVLCLSAIVLTPPPLHPVVSALAPVDPTAAARICSRLSGIVSPVTSPRHGSSVCLLSLM